MTDTDTYDESEPLLTISEAAKVAHCSPDSLRRWANTGKVKSIVTPGGHRRFRRSDLAELLKASS